MAPITHSVEINRPPEEVFAYIDDLARHKEWQDGIVEREGQHRRPDKGRHDSHRDPTSRQARDDPDVGDHRARPTAHLRLPRHRRPRPGRRQRIGRGCGRGTLARHHLPRLRGSRPGEADAAARASRPASRSPGIRSGSRRSSRAALRRATGPQRNGERLRAAPRPDEPEPPLAAVLHAGNERQ